MNDKLPEFVINPNHASIKAACELKEKAEKIKHVREGWGLPPHHADFIPSKDGPWGQKLQELSGQLGKGFLIALTGDRGNGKTQLAAELMKEVTNGLRRACYITTTRFFMRVKDTYREDSPLSEEGVINSFCAPSLLVIDEFGKQPEKEWHSTLLFELLNSRYGSNTDTLLIDNRTVEELKRSLGPSIISRMQETGGIVDCNWPSFRKGKV